MKARHWLQVAASIFFLGASFAFGDPAPIVTLPSAALDQDSQPLTLMRRFALVVGCNGGGAGRERLKYAGSDARSFAAVMTELGGVRPSDLTLLLDPGLARIEGALAALRDEADRAAGAGLRSELVFYYSGHSDETGLLIGAEKFSYPELRSELDGVRADLRVAILDSCSSGAMTRAKGGSPRPAFVFDESSDMKGHAYITSSSAAESAQESDRLGGSFFTHYLVSGLRGAADSLGQGRVTLNEAYAYAFKETLASTERTQFGPQHPAYEINLTGSGDLVLTDLRTASAGLLFAEDVQGRIFVRDARGTLAVELTKTRGKRVRIGIEPGSYSVLVDDGGSRLSSELRIAKGGYALLSASGLRPVPATATAARGTPLIPGLGAVGVETPVFTIQVLPDLGQALFTSAMDRVFAVNALVGSTRELRGFEVAGLLNTDAIGVTGFQAAGLANATLGSAAAFQAAGLVNYAGGDLGWFNVAGLANIVGGRARGAQIAGLLNLTQAGRVLYAGKESLGFVGELPAAASEINFGFQAAGLGNIDLGPFAGFQVATFNWTASKGIGVQIAGLFNASANFAGFQLAPVNVGRELRGLQLGVVNVAGELWGSQFGLVNVATRIHGPAFGLVSIEKDGVLAFEGTIDPDGRAQAAMKVGTRFSYTILSLGAESPQNPQNWNLSLGLGARLPLGPYFIDADAQWRAYSKDRGSAPSMLPGSQSIVGRALFGARLDGPLALVGGGAVEFLIPGLSLGADGSPVSTFAWTPSFVFGFQL